MAIIIKRKPAAASKAPDPVVPYAPKVVSVKELLSTAKRVPKSTPKERTLDLMCRGIMAEHPNAVVSWWLLASYLYYVHDLKLLSDELYDQMASDMLSRWDQIEHRHKHVITKGDLETGSLFALSAKEYPMITRHSAMELVKTEWGVLIDPNKDCH